MKRFLLFACTLLGLMVGFFSFGFICAHSGLQLEPLIRTMQDWTWQDWVLSALVILVPTVTGLVMGATGNGIGRLFATPFVALLVEIVVLLAVGLLMVFIKDWRVFLGAAVIFLIVGAVPVTKTVTVVIFEK